jgi:ATP-dependent DNA ligase
MCRRQRKGCGLKTPLTRYRRHDTRVFLYAFDLIELNGDDLRRDPLEVGKTTLATVLTGASHGIWYNDHVEGDGQTVFRHACKLGLEGIVSKRKDSPYRSGRSPDWLKDEEPGALGGEAGGRGGLALIRAKRAEDDGEKRYDLE